MLRYSLRTLLILLAVGQPVLAGAWLYFRMLADNLPPSDLPPVYAAAVQVTMLTLTLVLSALWAADCWGLRELMLPKSRTRP